MRVATERTELKDGSHRRSRRSVSHIEKIRRLDLKLALTSSGDYVVNLAVGDFKDGVMDGSSVSGRRSEL